MTDCNDWNAEEYWIFWIFTGLSIFVLALRVHEEIQYWSIWVCLQYEPNRYRPHLAQRSHMIWWPNMQHLSGRSLPYKYTEVTGQTISSQNVCAGLGRWIIAHAVASDRTKLGIDDLRAVDHHSAWAKPGLREDPVCEPRTQFTEAITRTKIKRYRLKVNRLYIAVPHMVVWSLLRPNAWF